MKSWLKARYASYTSDGKFWLTVGAGALIVDMAIGYCAGIAQATFWHGAGAALLAAGFAFLPDAAYEEYEKRRYGAAIIMAFLCVPIGLKAYEQQLTYSAGMRHGEIQAVTVSNAKYDGAQDDVARSRDELKLLMGVLAAAKAEAPWASIVTASALREQIATIDKAIEAESAAKNGGCKRKCLDLMNQKKDVNAKIATAEKVENTEERIRKLQEIVDRAREKADKVEHKFSLNDQVARVTVKLFKLAGGSALAGDEEASMQYATIGSAGLGSLALLILAPVGFFLAGRRRISGHTDTAPSAPLIHDMTPTRLPSFGVSHESLGNLARIARRQVAA